MLMKKTLADNLKNAQRRDSRRRGSIMSSASSNDSPTMKGSAKKSSFKPEPQPEE
jgi:hypothetical protein